MNEQTTGCSVNCPDACHFPVPDPLFGRRHLRSLFLLQQRQALNVRSGPGKDYPCIGSIKYGELVAVDHDLGNGWSELVWGSVPGYVMTSLLSRTYPGPYNPKPSPSGGGTTPSTSDGSELNKIFKRARFVQPYIVYLRGTRGSGTVNVRWAPSTNSTLIEVYPYNSTMQVIAELGDWYQVVDPVTGVTGFVMSTFAYR